MTDPSEAAAAAERIATLSAASFAVQVGQPIALEIVSGPFAGQVLAGAMLESLAERPHARMPGSPRIPFVLVIAVPDPGDFTCGHCTIDVPGLGPASPVYIERTIPSGKNPAAASFAIQFG